jgi:hypothetical protein
MSIATRVLKFQSSDGDIDVPVRLFAPRHEAEVWSCRYEIDWPDGQWAHAAVGVDAVQAVLLALQMIGAVLYTSDYHKSGKLFWEKPGRGYGFPVPSNLQDMLIGDDKIRSV